MANSNEWSIGIMLGVVILAIFGVFIWLLVSKNEKFDVGYPTYPYRQFRAPTTLLN